MHLGIQFGFFDCRRGNEIPQVRPLAKKCAYHNLGMVRKEREKKLCGNVVVSLLTRVCTQKTERNRGAVPYLRRSPLSLVSVMQSK